MNGNSISSAIGVGAANGATCGPKATSDFNGNGHANLLWQGQNEEVVAFMMDVTSISYTLSVAIPGADW